MHGDVSTPEVKCARWAGRHAHVQTGTAAPRVGGHTHAVHSILGTCGHRDILASSTPSLPPKEYHTAAPHLER